MQTILVLEDMFLRVDWLRRQVRPGTRVVWARGVNSFKKLFTLLKPQLGMIILDHDLGATPERMFKVDWGSGPSDDPFGLDGRDAAHWLATQEFEGSVLIWSANVVPAEAMFAVLKGTKSVVKLPFMEMNFPILKNLVRARDF